MKHKKKATTNKKPETNICTKRNKVSFSAATEIINAQSQRITKDELVNKWYKRNEIKSFRKDANMVSRAFLFQKIRRKRINAPSVLLGSKTLCLHGLENRIDYNRRLQRVSVIRYVLSIQKKLQEIYGRLNFESHLAMASHAATLNVRRLATEAGKRVSYEIQYNRSPFPNQHEISHELVTVQSLVGVKNSEVEQPCYLQMRVLKGGKLNCSNPRAA